MSEALKHRLNQAFGELMRYCRGYEYDEDIIQQVIRELRQLFPEVKRPHGTRLTHLCSGCTNGIVGQVEWAAGGRICGDCKWQEQRRAKGVEI